MIHARNGRGAASAFGLLLALTLAACSGGGSGSGDPVPNEPGEPPPVEPVCEEGKNQFSSTFEGIQKLIFEKHGCTQDICHGSSRQGGLDLTPAVAYDNVFDKDAVGLTMKLIEPGDNDRSYLWLKLAAATAPGSVQIAGSPMPNGLPPLSADELELMRMWIYAGAPEQGTVNGTQELLNACLPDPEPIVIKPLDPPPPDQGVQFVLPQWDLRANSEFEGCFATYYDISQQVPDRFKDPSGELFRFKGFDLRQDPQSHHLLLYYSPLNFQPGGIDVHDASFGQWTCRGGSLIGQSCEPKDPSSCGEGGVCASELKPTFACIGYGPPSPQPAEIMGGAGQAQAYFPFLDGVFSQIPMKGVIYWNSHAFNITEKDTKMNGRINYLFAERQEYPVTRISVFDAIFDPDAAPFTEETYCNDARLPIGSRVFHLFAHMHQRGKHFWATLADGTQIYETFSFSDPTQQRYDPPLAFDSPDPRQRTIRYCATYNNGRNADGTPNVDKVTRLSRIPESAKGQPGGTCTPVACVAGRVGAPCRGEDDDAACDSSPGAGDGWCDACPITGGESTENEMFVLFGAMYIDEAAAARVTGVEASSSVVNGRSMVTEPIFPSFHGCVAPNRGMPHMSAHAGHMPHAGHFGGTAPHRAHSGPTAHRASDTPAPGDATSHPVDHDHGPAGEPAEGATQSAQG
jgi:hypothetical protein